jgi:hypothetical protein
MRNLQQLQLTWFQNLSALLLEKLSQKAEGLKINENNALFRSIEKMIADYLEEYRTKINAGVLVKTSDFVRLIKSRIESLCHVAEWDALVGF